VIGLKNGDMSAFEEIYHIHFKRVFHFANSFTLEVQDAEEITQDVFMKLWQKRSTIDIDKNLSNLLFTMAKNLVIDKMRHYTFVKKGLKIMGETQQLYTINSNNTEHLVNYYELSEIISKLVNQLPDGRRTIYKLNREKGFKYHEIADFLNISQGTVEKQMSLALKTLSNTLKMKYGIMVELVTLLGFFLFS
jgi:RNA polymerase sigma-70 factor (ECF subfamily)